MSEEKSIFTLQTYRNGIVRPTHSTLSRDRIPEDAGWKYDSAVPRFFLLAEDNGRRCFKRNHPQGRRCFKTRHDHSLKPGSVTLHPRKDPSKL